MPVLEAVLGVIYSIGTFFVIYALLALSLNLELGYGGISNFGKVAFYAIGAFAVGAIANRIAFMMLGKIFDITQTYNPNIADPFKLAEVNSIITYVNLNRPDIALPSYFISLIAGVLLAGLFGYLASYPALKLRIDYLGITLLVFGEIIRTIGNSYEALVAGPHSMAVVRPFAWITSLGYPAYVADMTFFAFSLLMLIIVYVLLERMLNSPFGRDLKAMRDDELAAMSLGKDLAKLKAHSMIIGSMIAGLAGGIYVAYTGAISASEYIPFITFIVWTIVLLGGAGNNNGALLGALIWIGLDRILRIIKDAFPALPFSVDLLRYLLTGVFIVLIITYRPAGILPEKEIKTVAWRRLEKEIKAEGGEE